MSIGPAAESRLLRRTRFQLALWSAGSTLVVLLALGTLLYAAVARQLASDSESQLRDRAGQMSSFQLSADPLTVPLPAGTVDAPVTGTPPGPVIRTDGGTNLGAVITFTDNAAAPGILFGGPASGTIAMMVGGATGTSVAPALDIVGYDEAIAGTASMRESTLRGVPVRIYSAPIGAGAGQAVQVVADRTTEVRTLQATLIVLIAGGAAVVLVAAAFGWLYAGRALVPIRDAVRRQREFAADASHELRTPLTVIRGNVALLRSGAGGAEGQREAVDDIDAEVVRMASLVDQLLLLARADSDAVELQRVDCDLAEEAGDALETFLPVAAGHGVHLELDVATTPMQGDPNRLRQLVGILVDNALRHAPDGGHVRVGVTPSGGRARLVVEDDGPGIRPDDLPRVFDRFWRAADAPAGGSGLGLAIAAWIAQRHEGTIRAENRPAGGARFVVELPATWAVPGGRSLQRDFRRRGQRGDHQPSPRGSNPCT